MWLVDVVVRRGHLSDAVLAESIMVGERPIHLDRCDLCGQRASEMGAWLDGVRDVAVDSADRAFSPERLAAQQAQILRRLEQMDEPARVIAFPKQTGTDSHQPTRRRVAPAWVGIAAAAGLVIGVIGGQVSARLGNLGTHQTAVVADPSPALPITAPVVEPPPMGTNSSLLDMDLDGITPSPLAPMDGIVPRLIRTTAMVSSGG